MPLLSLIGRQFTLEYSRGAWWLLSFCREGLMLDLITLAMGLAFFALSVGYAVACDRL